MTETDRIQYRKHGESPQPHRLGGLAARLGRSQGSLPAVLASLAIADAAGPFQSHPAVVRTGRFDVERMIALRRRFDNELWN